MELLQRKWFSNGRARTGQDQEFGVHVLVFLDPQDRRDFLADELSANGKSVLQS
jgi:hypothetical protein